MIMKSSEVMHVSITLFISIIVVFSNIPNIQTKCGEYLRILHGILSVPQNIVMDLNNVMSKAIP